MKDRLSKLTVASGILGLVLLFGVMLSGAAYPSLVFRIGAPLGLLFVFLSVGPLGLRYVRDICEAVREKQWMLAGALVIMLLVAGVLMLI